MDWTGVIATSESPATGPETALQGRFPGLATTAVVTALGAVLSFLAIGHKSLWGDEAASVFFSRDWSDMWRRLFCYESNMWLYYVLLHFWMKWGDSEAYLRSLSAVFNVATIPMVYALGSRLVCRRTGAIAALLLATNHFAIRYAQETRAYSLVMFLGVCSTYLFIEAVERRSTKLWIGYAVCVVLGIYAHFFAALVCFSHFVSLAMLGRRGIPWRDVLVSIVVMAALLLPMVLFQPLQGGQIRWIPSPTWYDLAEFYRFATGSWPLMGLYFMLVAAALLWALRQPGSGLVPSVAWRHLFILCLAVLPVLMAFAASVIAKPVLVNRYLIISLPALVLLAAAGVVHLPRPWMRVAVVAVLLSLTGRCVYWHYTGHLKHDWRGVTSWVLSEARPGDGVGFFSYMGKAGFQYYLDQHGVETPQFAMVDLGIEATRRDEPRFRLDAQLLERLPALHGRFWFVISPAADDADRDVILAALNARYKRRLERKFTYLRVLLFEEPV